MPNINLKDTAPKSRCNLMLHMGSHKADRTEIVDTPTPEATKTWKPIPHVTVLGLIERALRRNSIDIVNEAHGLSHDGARYFGLLEVASTQADTPMSRVVGIRNAHDKRFAAGIVAGAQVLVCDNLCFSGDIALARKHTTQIMNDLPGLADSAVEQLTGFWTSHVKRVNHYMNVALDDTQVHDLLIKSVDNDVMACSYIPKILEHWRKPAHLEFEPRTFWSLENAYTEVFKGNIAALPTRTKRLHELLDVESGL